MLSLALILASGIYLSASLPHHVAVTPAAILLGGSSLLMAINLAWLGSVKGFPWKRFRDVARWSFLAYCVIAGLIEYVFVRNHTRGGALVVLTLSLVVFAVHVPALMGFTVARYHRPASDSQAGT